MQLTDNHIKKFAGFYLCCVLLYFCWLWVSGLLLTALQPVFFTGSLDITQNLVTATGLTRAVLHSRSLCLLLDSSVPLLTIVLYLAVRFTTKGRSIIAVLTAIVGLVYFLVLTGVSYISIEGMVSFLFIPLIFSARSVKGFYFSMHCVRIIFLVIFFSSGLWKIRTGAAFHYDQMPAILLLQHAPMLVSNGQYWFSKFIYYLVSHPIFAYCLYLLATILELSFVTGFFTNRYDRVGIALLLLFLCLDYFLMGINYFSWLPFAGCLYYSKYRITGVADKP